jgi:hypothetical protein
LTTGRGFLQPALKKKSLACREGNQSRFLTKKQQPPPQKKVLHQKRKTSRSTEGKNSSNLSKREKNKWGLHQKRNTQQRPAQKEGGRMRFDAAAKHTL